MYKYLSNEQRVIIAFMLKQNKAKGNLPSELDAAPGQFITRSSAMVRKVEINVTMLVLLKKEVEREECIQSRNQC
jgi:hypothetical protein